MSCQKRANSVKGDLTFNFANVAPLAQLTLVAAALADGHARIAECDQRSFYFSKPPATSGSLAWLPQRGGERKEGRGGGKEGKRE